METDDILNRIFVKLDSFDVKIDDLCDRSTKTETKLDNYLDVYSKSVEKKDRNTKIAFSIIGVMFGLYAIIKELV